MTARVETPERTALEASRAKLREAEAARRIAVEHLVDAVREEGTRSRSLPAQSVPARVLDELTVVDDATAERDEWRTLVDELAVASAVSVERADPSAPSVATRARVEALIAARLYGHTVVDLGDTAGARRWRMLDAAGREMSIPHFASDLVMCRAAEMLVPCRNFARALLDVVNAPPRGSLAGAEAVLAATPFERALAVLGAIGANPAEDPCAPALDN